MAKQRIQKVLAESGVASRRAVEEMILEGRILVNGELVGELPCFVEPKDEIVVDNIAVRKRASDKRYFLLNKPKYVVCTQSDPEGRKRAIDLLPRMKERLYCVGRLDADSLGLILLTNDGELTQRLTHPSYEVHKRYHVALTGHITPEAIQKFKQGVWVDGKRTAPAQLKVIGKTREGSIIEVMLLEGRNREIRRILLRMGYKVKRLARVAIGPITDRGLKVGSCRELSAEEVQSLRDAGHQTKRVKGKRRPGKRPLAKNPNRARPTGKPESKSAPVKESGPTEITVNEASLGSAPRRRTVVGTDGAKTIRSRDVDSPKARGSKPTGEQGGKSRGRKSSGPASRKPQGRRKSR